MPFAQPRLEPPQPSLPDQHITHCATSERSWFPVYALALRASFWAPTLQLVSIVGRMHVDVDHEHYFKALLANLVMPFSVANFDESHTKAIWQNDQE
jgi:hypothetical protein